MDDETLNDNTLKIVEEAIREIFRDDYCGGYIPIKKVNNKIVEWYYEQKRNKTLPLRCKKPRRTHFKKMMERNGYYQKRRTIDGKTKRVYDGISMRK